MHVLPSNRRGTLDVHQTNMLVTCARFIISNSFLKNGEGESRDEEEGANLGYAVILTATQQCRIDVQHD